jgi:hypothetical protein
MKGCGRSRLTASFSLCYPRSSGTVISRTGTPAIQRADSKVRATYGVQAIVVCAPHAHVTVTDALSSNRGNQIVYARRSGPHAACASRNV